MKILPGKLIASKWQKLIYNFSRDQIIQSQNQASLAILLVGEDPASKLYVGLKTKLANKLGVTVRLVQFKNSIELEAVLAKLEELNEDDGIDGILLQSPIGKFNETDTVKCFNAISSFKDVDGLTGQTLASLWQLKQNQHTSNLVPTATPKAVILSLLFRYFLQEQLDLEGISEHDSKLKNIENYYSKIIDSFWEIIFPLDFNEQLRKLNQFAKGKSALIVNDSLIVGKPLAAMLNAAGITVTIANEQTQNLKKIFQNHDDIVITATGKPEIWSWELFKHVNTVIDLGSSRSKTKNKIGGDISMKTFNPAYLSKSQFWSLSPGGVGPLTVTALIDNVIKIKNKN